MKLKWILLCMAMIPGTPVLARDKIDIIVMKNGDKITCEIKGLRSNTLYISVDYILSTLSVDWSKVDHIESKQLFIVTTQDGTIYTSAISTPESSAARPMQIDVAGALEKKETLERKQVVSMDQTSKNFWRRLNGQLGWGLTYSKGNASSQYNLNSDVGYAKERWSASASYSSNLTSNTGSDISTRNAISLLAQRHLRWNNWYYAGLADFLESSVQGIQLQSTFGGGIGRNIKNTGGTFFTVYSGFAWQQINYHEDVMQGPTQQITSALIGTNLKLFKFDKTTLVVSAKLLPALSDPGRVHFNLNSSYFVKLWGKLNWNFSVYGDWDNRPPAGFSSSDYGTTSGISLSFGNR